MRKKLLAVLMAMVLVVGGTLSVSAASDSGWVSPYQYNAELDVSSWRVYAYLSLESANGGDVQGVISGKVHLNLGGAAATASIYEVGSYVVTYRKDDPYYSITHATCNYLADGTYLTSLTEYA